MMFDYPDLSPTSPHLGGFFHDLVALEREFRVVDPQAFVAIGEAARYYDGPREAVEEALLGMYGWVFGQSLRDGVGEPSVPAELVMPIALQIGETTRPHWIYRAKVDAKKEALKNSPSADAEHWLVGTIDTLSLLALPKIKTLSKDDSAFVQAGFLIWQARRGEGIASQARPNQSLDKRSVILTGGEWFFPIEGAAIRVDAKDRKVDADGYLAGAMLKDIARDEGQSRF